MMIAMKSEREAKGTALTAGLVGMRQESRGPQRLHGGSDEQAERTEKEEQMSTQSTVEGRTTSGLIDIGTTTKLHHEATTNPL